MRKEKVQYQLQAFDFDSDYLAGWLYILNNIVVRCFFLFHIYYINLVSFYKNVRK